MVGRRGETATEGSPLRERDGNSWRGSVGGSRAGTADSDSGASTRSVEGTYELLWPASACARCALDPLAWDRELLDRIIALVIEVDDCRGRERHCMKGVMRFLGPRRSAVSVSEGAGRICKSCMLNDIGS